MALIDGATQPAPHPFLHLVDHVPAHAKPNTAERAAAWLSCHPRFLSAMMVCTASSCFIQAVTR